ncbi:MAG: hypothetical protein CTY37_07300 [Methylotenera sp.]|nr:MAG: hypothetical protein CTY37_07300 [Methylotenera sp.]PPD17314.1 MAG: hypothetical protein CTY27_04105 [Methylotenera sp.]
MNLKLNFLLPDMKVANQASQAMLLARVEDKNVCFLARPGTNLGLLQPATALEATNTFNEGLKGILMGAGLGLLGGLYVLYFPAWFTDSPLWFTNASDFAILTVTTFIGAVAAAIGAALLGVNILNTDLTKYGTRINDGAVLMIVSVPYRRANEIRKIVSKLHLKF